MTRWVATAFEPFGAIRRNPSMDVLRGIRTVRPAAAGSVLPVTWSVADIAGPTMFADHARVAVHLGVAASRIGVHLERSARNTASGVDNDGASRVGPLDDGAARMMTALRLERLLVELRSRWSSKVAVSDDCGRYICNATYRASLRSAPPGRTALFVHVPLFSPEDAVSFGMAFAGAMDALTRTW